MDRRITELASNSSQTQIWTGGDFTSAIDLGALEALYDGGSVVCVALRLETLWRDAPLAKAGSPRQIRASCSTQHTTRLWPRVSIVQRLPVRALSKLDDDCSGAGNASGPALDFNRRRVKRPTQVQPSQRHAISDMLTLTQNRVSRTAGTTNSALRKRACMHGA